MHSTVSLPSALLAMATLAGCTVDAARIVGPDDWDVLFEIRNEAIATVAASPDGALFIATTEAVYRYIPADNGTFERLMPAPGYFPQFLAAPSRRVVYHVTTGDSAVSRWEEGMGRTQILLPPLEPWMTCGDDCIQFNLAVFALWARSETEAFAAGDYGVVVSITGTTARLEPTPMLEFARGAIGSDAIYRARLNFIDGDAERVLIGSNSALLQGRNGAWDTLPNPWRLAPGCAGETLVLQGDLLLFGGLIPFPGSEMPCMVAVSGGRAERLDTELRGFGQPGIQRGARQPDGSALFHASSYGRGEVAVFRGKHGRVYAFPELEWFGGAAIVGRYLYAGGQLGENAVIVRAPLGSRFTVPQN